MSDLATLQTAAKRLPARALHALAADDLPADTKREYAEQVWDLIDARLHELIWAGATDEKILAALQTEYELDPEVDPLDMLALVAEMQPDLPEKIEAELENIYQELTSSN